VKEDSTKKLDQQTLTKPFEVNQADVKPAIENQNPGIEEKIYSSSCFSWV